MNPRRTKVTDAKVGWWPLEPTVRVSCGAVHDAQRHENYRACAFSWPSLRGSWASGFQAKVVQEEDLQSPGKTVLGGSIICRLKTWFIILYYERLDYSLFWSMGSNEESNYRPNDWSGECCENTLNQRKVSRRFRRAWPPLTESLSLRDQLGAIKNMIQRRYWEYVPIPNACKSVPLYIL